MTHLSYGNMVIYAYFSGSLSRHLKESLIALFFCFQENWPHFAEEKPEWCNALLAEICPKSCGQCDGECIDKGDWCMDRLVLC